MKRRFGDRKDGYRLRKADPFFRVIPYIMKERSDAQVFFEDRIYLDQTNVLIRKLRKEGYKLGFLHVLIASMVRTMSQKPKINRFVRGHKTYARRDISFSLAVKKDMSELSEETTIKVTFEPDDTIYDVVNKINNEINNNKGETDGNDTDKAAKILSIMPGFILNGTMNFFRFLDNRGRLPRFLTNLSPFHSSCFVTDLGSLGIKSVYHHIYNFGTNSIFISFGTRSKEQVVGPDLQVVNKKAMDIKVVVDERVVDGYYFASAIKYAKDIMDNPLCLLEKPNEIVIDDEI